MAEQSKKARHNNTCYHRKFCDLRIVLYVTVVSETTHEVGLTSWQKRVSTSSVSDLCSAQTSSEDEYSYRKGC